MRIPQIIEIKNQLELLKSEGFIDSWQLPYENLLTRLNAAIFFLTPSDSHKDDPRQIWEKFSERDDFQYRLNEEKKLSQLTYRITFNREEE